MGQSLVGRDCHAQRRPLTQVEECERDQTGQADQKRCPENRPPLWSGGCAKPPFRISRFLPPTTKPAKASKPGHFSTGRGAAAGMGICPENRQPDQRARQDRAGHAGQPEQSGRQQHPGRGAEQVGRIDAVTATCGAGQRRADPQPCAEKGQGQRQVVEHEVENLPALPGDAVGIERQQVHRGIGQPHAGREAQTRP
ncbi:MAG: DUF3602 domain-containing protein [Chloroflexi bacterium]|nr:DUF3602 domain-containing protein [Chloroflexota bacterium]